MSRLIGIYGGLILLAMLGCEEGVSVRDDTYTDQIRLNQVGYYPDAQKKAVVVAESEISNFSIVESNTGETVFSGEISGPFNWELAGEQVHIADFSELQKEGSYQLYIEDLGYSFPFEIKEHVLHPVYLGSIKGLYFQRAGMALDEQYASQWNRALGHPDDSVLFHPSSGKHSGFLNSP